MITTTWDGRLRIDHVAGADADTVALTLITLEPARELRLRPGLVVGFVPADPHGPPTFIAVGLRQDAVPADVVTLLGPRVSAAVADVVDDGVPGRWLQLDLVEVNNLATAWAPYRAVVLESARPAPVSTGTLGSWANELWTCLGLPDWRTALMPHTGTSHAFRGQDRSPGEKEPGPSELRGTWRLPEELAATVGVDPEVNWTLRSRKTETTDTVDIELRARPTGPTRRAGLQAGVDDGAQHWATFEPDKSGILRARLVSDDEEPSVRFRSARGE